jgi:hypothetical protein
VDVRRHFLLLRYVIAIYMGLMVEMGSACRRGLAEEFSRGKGRDEMRERREGVRGWAWEMGRLGRITRWVVLKQRSTRFHYIILFNMMLVGPSTVMIISYSLSASLFEPQTTPTFLVNDQNIHCPGSPTS